MVVWMDYADRDGSTVRRLTGTIPHHPEEIANPEPEGGAKDLTLVEHVYADGVKVNGKPIENYNCDPNVVALIVRATLRAAGVNYVVDDLAYFDDLNESNDNDSEDSD